MWITLNTGYTSIAWYEITDTVWIKANRNFCFPSSTPTSPTFFFYSASSVSFCIPLPVLFLSMLLVISCTTQHSAILLRNMPNPWLRIKCFHFNGFQLNKSACRLTAAWDTVRYHGLGCCWTLCLVSVWHTEQSHW